MKRILILIFLGMFLILGDISGQSRKEKKANKETTEWKYDIESEALGNQNIKVLRVWSYSKDPKIAKNQAIKNAVHGIIFQGAPGDPDKRVAPVSALVTDVNALDKHADFFEAFFAEGGDYRKYASATNISDEIVRLKKRMYKVGVVVNVKYDAIRKMLEEKGVIRKLGSGF